MCYNPIWLASSTDSALPRKVKCPWNGHWSYVIVLMNITSLQDVHGATGLYYTAHCTCMLRHIYGGVPPWPPPKNKYKHTHAAIGHRATSLCNIVNALACCSLFKGVSPWPPPKNYAHKQQLSSAKSLKRKTAYQCWQVWRRTEALLQWHQLLSPQHGKPVHGWRDGGIEGV